MKTGPVIRIATVNDAAEVSRLLKSAMLTYCTDSRPVDAIAENANAGLYARDCYDLWLDVGVDWF